MGFKVIEDEEELREFFSAGLLWFAYRGRVWLPEHIERWEDYLGTWRNRGITKVPWEAAVYVEE